MAWEAFVDDQKISEGTVQEEGTVDIEWPSWVVETIGEVHTFKVVVDGSYEESMNFGGPECVSATPTPTPTPTTTESPTQTPTVSPTTTPTEFLSPTPTTSPSKTPTPTLTLTLTPTPTGTPQPSSTPTPRLTSTPTPPDETTSTPEPTSTPVVSLPEAGVVFPTVWLTGISLVLILVGILL
jgi:hypothetical protein